MQLITTTKHLSRRGLLALCLAALWCPVNALAQRAGAEPVRMVVYGASGRFGSRIVREALDRGHYVLGVTRNPSEMTQRHTRFAATQGDVLQPESVARIVAGHDVVSGSHPDSDDPAQSIPRPAAESLVTALRGLGERAPRMIVIGGGSTTLEVSPGVVIDDPTDSLEGPRGVRLVGHKFALDYLRTISDVRWTYLSPPLEMRPGERTGRFRVGGDLVLRDRDGRSWISMEDMAAALIDEVEQPRQIGRRFTVGY